MCPSFSDLEKIQPGYFVQIGVRPRTKSIDGPLYSERFWGFVRRRDGDAITISVKQDMVYTSYHGIKNKDVLEITTSNVLRILNGDWQVVWDATLPCEKHF